jgi:hypothetical protein
MNNKKPSIYLLHELFDLQKNNTDNQNLYMLFNKSETIKFPSIIKEKTYYEFFFENDITGILNKPFDHQHNAYLSVKRQLEDLVTTPDNYKHPGLINKQKDLEKRFSDSLDKFKKYKEELKTLTLEKNNILSHLELTNSSQIKLGKNFKDYLLIIDKCKELKLSIPNDLIVYLFNNNKPHVISTVDDFNNFENKNEDDEDDESVIKYLISSIDNISYNVIENDSTKTIIKLNLNLIDMSNTYLLMDECDGFPILTSFDETGQNNKSHEFELIKNKLEQHNIPVPQELLNLINNKYLSADKITILDKTYNLFNLKKYTGNKNAYIYY